MLFQHIDQLENKSMKKSLLEKVNLMIRTMEEYCSFANLDLANHLYDQTTAVQEIIDIGLISSESDLPKLKKILGADFERFLQIVDFYQQHREETDFILENFYNHYRQQLQKQVELDNESPRIADFFAGAGGLSLGFVQEGFQIQLANEIEEVAVETYKFNHPEVQEERILQKDIKEILDQIDDYVDREVDVIIGGPPCQSFSNANRQRIIDDPRNILYKYFVQAVEIIKPRFVVMENVKGMRSVADQVVEDFHQISVDINGEKVDYEVDYHVFNSHDFSVAQNRERLIYIGVRRDVKETLNLSASQIIDDILVGTMNNPRYFLRHALEHIKPLKAAEVKNMTEVDHEEYGKKVDKNEYYHQSNEYLELINEGRKQPIVYNHKARFNNENDREIYRRLEQGEDSTSERVKDIMPYQHRSHIFKDKYFKLVEDKPSRTITAHMKMDCHSHIHPRQVRSLTPREAARIQSFPDDYVFLGPYLKTYMQIGNAVPPLMARGFASVLKGYLNKLTEKDQLVKI
ncbi:DNA (cytosine-5)-methyltransferase 1 [Oceanobacillus limi]|uniref:Cytosine-specific methyltransferase n=1 Tax=Oceanobacillus limi TaxID=930131 RepID=A0A1H9Y072_9BACI|nr:DNA cytosine methyltransferase [Oceanobacillus limi]SES62019.1 DNA (cytosine-5)-methyltransferase 1 [Oceanobacillus limi]